MKNALGAIEIAADIFALVRAVARELPVFPLQVELVEAERGELMIWRVSGLLGGIEHGRSRDGSAASGIDALGIFFARDPQHLIQPVDAPVTERAIGEVEVVAKSFRMDAMVEWPQRRRQRVRH